MPAVSAADTVYFNCFRLTFGMFMGCAALLIVRVAQPLFVAPPTDHSRRQLERANASVAGWTLWSEEDSVAACSIFMISCAQALLLMVCFCACRLRARSAGAAGADDAAACMLRRDALRRMRRRERMRLGLLGQGSVKTTGPPEQYNAVVS
jgi:hypothetical protein